MPAPTTGRWRSVRAGAFALIAAQIAIGGHLSVGGGPPDLTLLIAMSVLLVGCLHALGRQRRGFGSLLVAMAVTQVVFHLLLTLSDARHPMAPVDDHPIRMWAFHAVTAVISAGLLAYGEAVLFSLHSWLSRLIPRLPTPFPITRLRGWTAVLLDDCRVLNDHRRGTSVFRRGPPIGITAAR